MSLERDRKWSLHLDVTDVTSLVGGDVKEKFISVYSEYTVYISVCVSGIQIIFILYVYVLAFCAIADCEGARRTGGVDWRARAWQRFATHIANLHAYSERSCTRFASRNSFFCRFRARTSIQKTRITPLPGSKSRAVERCRLVDVSWNRNISLARRRVLQVRPVAR